MTTASTARPVVRSTEEGERRWFFGGGEHIWKATAEETNGAFMLFEDRMAPGKVTPLHTHPDSDETMIVLDGAILMHLDGVEHAVEAGGVAVAPRGVPHAFKVTSAGGRPAAVPAHPRLLPGVLLGRQRAAGAGSPAPRSSRHGPGAGVGARQRRHRDPRSAPLRAMTGPVLDRGPTAAGGPVRDTRATRRTLTAGAVVLAPLLVGVVRLITPVVNDEHGAEVVRAFGEHLTAARISLVTSVVAAVLLPFFVLGLYRLSCRRTPVLAGVGAVLAIAGWAMLPVRTAGDVVAYELARTGADPTLWDHFANTPAVVLATVVFIAAHEIGMVVLGAALWRSRTVPTWAAAAVVVGVVAHLVGVVTSSRVVDVLGFAALVLGSAMAARAILATTDVAWDLPPVRSDAPATTASPVAVHA